MSIFRSIQLVVEVEVLGVTCHELSTRGGHNAVEEDFASGQVGSLG